MWTTMGNWHMSDSCLWRREWINGTVNIYIIEEFSEIKEILKLHFDRAHHIPRKFNKSFFLKLQGLKKKSYSNLGRGKKVTFKKKRNHMLRRKNVENIYQTFNINYSRNGFIGNFYFLLLISDCFNFHHICLFS